MPAADPVHMGRHDAAHSALDAAHDAWQPSNPEDAAELNFVAALVERDLGRVDVAEELAGSAVRLRTGTPDRRAAVVDGSPGHSSTCRPVSGTG